jgi:hypothetical protein
MYLHWLALIRTVRLGRKGALFIIILLVLKRDTPVGNLKLSNFSSICSSCLRGVFLSIIIRVELMGPIEPVCKKPQSVNIILSVRLNIDIVIRSVVEILR